MPIQFLYAMIVVIITTAITVLSAFANLIIKVIDISIVSKEEECAAVEIRVLSKLKDFVTGMLELVPKCLKYQRSRSSSS